MQVDTEIAYLLERRCQRVHFRVECGEKSHLVFGGWEELRMQYHASRNCSLLANR